MPRNPAFYAAATLLLAACTDATGDAFSPSGANLAAASPGAITVSSAGDAGESTLRAAILAANADEGITRIRLERGLGRVELATPLVYTGAQPLTIEGAGIVIDASGLPDASGTPALDAAIVANGGGDFTVRDLTVEGSPGVGILVDVPDARTGVMAVVLEALTVEGSVLHGVLINDQVDYFTDRDTRAAGGSSADLQVRVRASRMTDNGFGGIDNDGLRINEGGAGSLDAVIMHSEFSDNGADGIELDERGDGDAVFALEHVVINRNGSFSSLDYDDGIDVDELGAGNLVGRFVQVTARENYEQGVDLNENNLGDLLVTMHGVSAEANREEGIEFEEDDDFEDFPGETWGGNMDVTLTGVTANRNAADDGDAGLKVREKSAGNLMARIVNPVANDNEVTGIEVREGQGGAMDAEVVHASALRNDGWGVRFRGNGVARLQAFQAGDNADGAWTAEPGVVVTETGQ